MADVYASITDADPEVGCGTGAVTRELARWPRVAEVTGIDPSPTFLDRARHLDPPANASFVDGDARYVPTIVERGADSLVAGGRIGPEAVAALKAETGRW